MFDDRRPDRRPTSTGLLLMVVLVAACGSSASSLAPSVAPTVASTPTAIPTPSPSPVDVPAAFVEAMADPTFSATATITGTLTVGKVDGHIIGSALFSGANSSQSLTITTSGYMQQTESVQIGDASWSRQAPGPWLKDPAKPVGQNDSLNGILKTLSTVQDLGIESRGGEPLHHLRSSKGNAVPPSVFGVTSGTTRDAVVTLDFYATDTGAPAILAIDGSWIQVDGATEVPTRMAFDIALGDIGKPQTIVAPDDVWVRYSSKVHHYTMAHPADWTVKTEEFLDTYLRDGVPVVYVAIGPYTGTTAALVTALKKTYAKDLGDPAGETATRLGGQPAVRLTYTGKSAAGMDTTLADDIISRDGTGWEVYIATTGGAADLALFDGFVASFEFAD